MRVIADMVMNHTSDQHPWFQESRDPGSRQARLVRLVGHRREVPGRADHLRRHREVSNWTHDPEAGAYYWHRFFSHQPDLNYDNPEVHEAMLDVVRFWLAIGLDGLRLDAVPYLFEREGTNCENLPETHDDLKNLRKVVDDEFENKILLAEANQWPADVVDYFGDGDECQMAFHFPVMPRMFMGLRREEAKPIVEIMNEHPADPRELPVGHLPAQPRRADARDGHRRRARLHVQGVRARPADEDERRHPPPPRPAARQQPPR